MKSLRRKQYVLSSTVLKEDLSKARKITICLDRWSNLSSTALKEDLSKARKIIICLDRWSKKSLSSSFLGISACYFDATTNKPRHALLNLNDKIGRAHV